MTVLEGEGRVTILYGSQSLPMSPYRSVYLSRPDLDGRHPAVIVAHGASGLTPSVKAACRRLARYGYIAVAPELRWGGDAPPEAPGAARVQADLEDAVEALQRYWHDWAVAERLAVLGLGEGGPAAARLAASHDAATILMGGTAAIEVDAVASGTGPLLALVAAADAGSVKAFHEGVGRGQWIRYGDVGSGFHDEGSSDYRAASAEDAYERIIEFLDRHLASIAAA